MSQAKEQAEGGLAEALQRFAAEFADCWRRLPNKGLFFGLLAAWLVLFNILGSSTFGYYDNPSLLAWMLNAYTAPLSDDGHGVLVPVVVLVLFWWKRRELLALRHTTWGPGLALVALGLGFHLFGYLLQQPRLSVIGFFVGIYGLMGLAWGPQWLRTSFFPFFLFAFCVPVGSLGEPLTFPLRVLVTKIVAGISQGILGLDVLRDGTRVYNPERNYQYEVAAACSGIRSLIATIAIATIYGFTTFRQLWKRGVLLAAAVPLAVIGNVFRMMTIVIAAEISGQDAGSYVHENAIFSLLPYVPAIGGLLLLGRWLEGPLPPPAAPEKGPEP